MSARPVPLRPLFLLGLASLALVVLVNQTALPPQPYGAQGAEGEPNRAQQWLVPTPLADRGAHALLFRPPGEGPFRLAVIAHASSQNALRRTQMTAPEYRALAGFLVARGLAVLVPERLGHGATGGAYLEDQGGCEDADYARAARATAEQIKLALAFMSRQPFIRTGGAIIIGHSAGGWGALALAGEDQRMLSAIIAFAPGRGGHANDVENRVCAPERLIEVATSLGKGARVPVTWLVAENDTYFSPAFSQRLAGAFRGGGGKVAFSVLPATGREGHWLAESESGINSASTELERALTLVRPVTSKKQ